MAQVLQLRRGTTAQNDTFTGAAGEVTVDTDRESLRVHDGVTMGGKEIADLQTAVPLLPAASSVSGSDTVPVIQSGVARRATKTQILNGIVDANIDAAANISGTKLANNAVTTAKIADSNVTTAKIADSNVTTAKINNLAVTSAKLAYDGGPMSGFRNLIINGGMQIAQRGSVAVSAGPTNYTLDRWNVLNSGTGLSATASSSAQTAAQSNYEMNVTGSWTNGITYIFQRIESRVAAYLFNKPFVVSLWVYHDFGSTTNFTVQALSANSQDNFSALTGITATSGATAAAANLTGTRIVAVFPANTNLNNGLQIQISHAQNTVSSKTLRIWDVQVEQGTVATPFETRPIGAELALCQRYFYMHAEGLNVIIGHGSNYSTTQAEVTVFFKTTMRVVPTLYQTTGSNYYTFVRNVGSDDVDSLSMVRSTVNSALVFNSTQVSGTAGQAVRLETNNASAAIGFQAEL